MRLKSVFISKCKNLNDFTLNFDGDSFIDVFVGKNGTGKSNLFEALIEIFRHVVESRDKLVATDLSYQLQYEIDDQSIEIVWDGIKLSINGQDRKTTRSASLPDNVLIYYSGHNDAVGTLVGRYEEEFRKKIKSAKFDESRFFIGIVPEYKELLIAMLLVQPETNTARQYICQKLGVKTVAPEIRLVLERPSYAQGKPQYEIEDLDEDRYWKPEGITKTFLDRLSKCIDHASAGPVRSEGYFAKEDRYILYFSIAEIQKEFDDFNAQELFRQFDNLKTLGMLAEISIPLTRDGDVKADISHFSDGQFQSVYIYSIIEMFKDRNCITLLDEPDSFLHPEWQFDFFKQISKITDTAAKNNHVLMSSHSAVTLIAHNDEKITSLFVNNNRISSRKVSKYFAIDDLGAKHIRYSKQEQILCLIKKIREDSKPVLFTEGETDSTILKEAWHRLYEEMMPFELCPVFGCDQVKQLLTNKEVRSENEQLPMFGLFDYDLAFNQWKWLNKTPIQSDPYDGQINQLDGKESYGIMIPIPRNDEIENLVIKDPESKETFGAESCVEIEHLFYGIESTVSYFKKDQAPGGGTKIVFSANKKQFANDVVPTLPDDMFQIFQPMFEFICDKC